jgi:hypothetical protein
VSQTLSPDGGLEDASHPRHSERELEEAGEAGEGPDDPAGRPAAYAERWEAGSFLSTRMWTTMRPQDGIELEGKERAVTWGK